MKNICILDCTLRDGGYCNQWKFGYKNIRKIVNGLEDARVDIIELGFLTNRVEYNIDQTKFTDLNQVKKFIISNNKEMYVIMINYGEYFLEDIPLKCETIVDGIRVAFHKKDWQEAIKFCSELKKKGYLVFLQPMVSMLYSDTEFIELIKSSNIVEPYAFYIVDSFGSMKKKNVLHYFELVKKYLSDKIIIGFHAHNNLQSAYSNAMSLIEKTKRALIVDTSVYGMGRGAGNLNTELLVNDLNDEVGTNYDIKPLLRIMDEVLAHFYAEKPWGYSLPNYLSAVHIVHPNYASYLEEKKTLRMEDIDNIFFEMSKDKCIQYDKSYINDLYIEYMSKGIVNNSHLDNIRKMIDGKKILLIAPGYNALAQKEIIEKFIDENKPIVISINHVYPLFKTDYIFVSNIRRFKEIDYSVYDKTISTSNIKTTETYLSIDYYKLLNEIEIVRDNATLMAIKFIISELDIKEIYLAGVDGYTYDASANYETKEMALFMLNHRYDEINEGMRTVIRNYSKNVKISFITSTILEK